MGCAAWAWYGMMDGWKIEIWHTSLTGLKKKNRERHAWLLIAGWRAWTGYYDYGFRCVRSLSWEHATLVGGREEGAVAMLG